MGWLGAVTLFKLRLPPQEQLTPSRGAALTAHTWWTPKVTVAALYILQYGVYDHFCEREAREAVNQLKFEDCICQRGKHIPQFQYWQIVLELELLLHIYVHSLKQVSFIMYLDALTELTCWFHAFDHTKYARWIPLHLKDMADKHIQKLTESVEKGSS